MQTCVSPCRGDRHKEAVQCRTGGRRREKDLALVWLILVHRPVCQSHRHLKRGATVLYCGRAPRHALRTWVWVSREASDETARRRRSRNDKDGHLAPSSCLCVSLVCGARSGALPFPC